MGFRKFAALLLSCMGCGMCQPEVVRGWRCIQNESKIYHQPMTSFNRISLVVFSRERCHLHLKVGFGVVVVNEFPPVPTPG